MPIGSNGQGIDVGDAILTFLSDTTQLDQAFARIPAQAEASMGKAAASVGQVGDAVDGVTKTMAVGQQGAVELGEVTTLAGTKTRESMYQARGELILLGDMFGFHLPRHVAAFIAELPGLGAALSGAFAATAVIFLIEKIVTLIAKHEQLALEQRHAAEETENLTIKQEDLVLGLHAANLALEDQISKLEGRPAVNTLLIALLAVKKGVDDLATTYAADFQKMDKEVEDQLGLWAGLKRAAMDVALVLDEMVSPDKKDEGQTAARIKGNKEEVAALHALLDAQNKLNEARQKLHDEDPTKNMEAWKAAAGAVAIAAGAVQSAADTAKAAVEKVEPDAHKLIGTLTDKARTAKGEWKAMAEEITKAGLEAKKARDEIANAASALGDVAFRRQAVEAKEAADQEAKIWEEHYREAVSKLQESEREKIDATRQGSKARLAAIDAAIKEEQSKGLQDTQFYKSLQIQRVQAVEAALTAEQKAENQAAADKLKLAETSAKVQIAAITEAYSQQEKAVEMLASFHLMSEGKKARTLELLYQQEKDALLKTLKDTLKEEQDAIAASQAKLTTAKSNPFISPQQITELEKLLHEAEKLEADTQIKISNTTKQFNDKELATAKGHYGKALALTTAYGKELLAEQLKENHAELLAAQQELALTKARGQDTTAIQQKIVVLKQHEQQLEKEANGNKQLIAQQLQLINAQLLGAQAVLADAKARGLDTTAIEKEIARLKQLQIETKKTTQDTNSLKQAEDNLNGAMQSMEQSLGSGFANAMEQVMTGQKTIGQAGKEMVANLAEQWGKFFIAKGIADMFTDPAAGAIELAEGTALLALGVALGAGGSSSSGSGANPNQGSGLIAGQTSSSGGGSQQVVSVTHLAEGGLVTGPTRAMVGENGAEAVIPLNDPAALARFAGALLSPSTLRAASTSMASSEAPASTSAARSSQSADSSSQRDSSGAGDTHTHYHTNVTVKGMISPDNLQKVVKEINRKVQNNQLHLKASDSLRVTRRSQ